MNVHPIILILAVVAIVLIVLLIVGDGSINVD